MHVLSVSSLAVQSLSFDPAHLIPVQDFDFQIKTILHLHLLTDLLKADILLHVQIVSEEVKPDVPILSKYLLPLQDFLVRFLMISVSPACFSYILQFLPLHQRVLFDLLVFHLRSVRSVPVQ